MMSGWNLEVGIWQMIWTNVVMGLGFGMSFPSCRRRRCRQIERERMGYATSLFNMLQQQGRAIGIAYMTNVLVRNQQIHQARLVEHFSIFDAWRLSKLSPLCRAPRPFIIFHRSSWGRNRHSG